MTTTHKKRLLRVEPYCHACVTTSWMLVRADFRRIETCDGCGRPTLSGIYAVREDER